MAQFIFYRLLQAVPTVFGVVCLTFFFIHLVPGDPVEVILGEHALAADREELRTALGLNLPIGEQFLGYLKAIAQADLGTSLYNGREVTALILERLPATLKLAGVALAFAIILAVPFGVFAATFKNAWPDRLSLGLSLLGFSMPNFWLGPLLVIIFALWLGVLPVSGDEGGVYSLILPAITLGTGMAAVLLRLVRASLLEVLDKDFMRTAKAKGAGFYRVVFLHGLRNALLPVLTAIFLQAGALLTGAIITETIFAWPGVGSLMVDALNLRDYALVQGCILFIACTYVLMTLLADLSYALVDPRIRFKGKGV